MTSVEEPMITAVIPTYRRPSILPRAVQSVLRQTYRRLQVCVYDNASGDDTSQVVARMAAEDPRIKYYCHDTNIGAMANFQYGMKNVNTPYYVILSDDDLLLPTFLEEALQGLDEHPDAAFFAGSVVCVSEDSRSVGYVPLHFWPRDGYFATPHIPPVPSALMYPYCPPILFRRRLIEEVGEWDPDTYMIDIDLVMRTIARFPFVLSKTPAGIFTLHAESSLQKADLDRYWPACLKMRNNVVQDDRVSKEVRERLGGLIDNGFISWFQLISKRYLQVGNFVDAYRIAEILHRDYDCHHQAQRLERITRWCESVPGAHRAYLAKLALDRFIDRWFGQTAKLNRAYGYVSQYLSETVAS